LLASIVKFNVHHLVKTSFTHQLHHCLLSLKQGLLQ
jgi:hypothetical protein